MCTTDPPLYSTTFDLTGGSDWCQIYGDLIYADNHCNAKVVSSPCVSTAPLDLKCPAGNGVLYRAPEVETYHPRVLCKVCKVMSIPEDTDLGQDTYSGTLTFGPNQIDNTLDETYIKAYKVYFASANLTKFGTAVATITVNSPVSISTCGCTGNEHSVTLSMVGIPSDATGFMIVVVDSYDMEMPVGTYVGGLIDKWTTTTTTTTTTSATTTTTTSLTATVTATTTSTVTIKAVVSFAPGRTLSAILLWLAAAAVAVVIA
jgi:hypothetical protein